MTLNNSFSISGPVGQSGRNNPVDVERGQTRLIARMIRPGPNWGPTALPEERPTR